jgi:hypothetical protein
MGGGGGVPVVFGAAVVQQLTCATSADSAHRNIQGLQPWLFLQQQAAMRNGAGVPGE